MGDARIPDDDGIQPADIAAVRGEGRSELRDLMRAQIAIGRALREPPKRPPPVQPPGHRPGAWPSGTSPPGPLKPQPPGAWAHALERYRLGLDRESDPCHCGGCDTPDNDTEEN